MGTRWGGDRGCAQESNRVGIKLLAGLAAVFSGPEILQRTIFDVQKDERASRENAATGL
jgi:hypothetical protein